MIQSLLDDYMQCAIPDNFNDLLLAVTVSVEVHGIFSATVNYFQNLLILKDSLTQLKKSQGVEKEFIAENVATFVSRLTQEQLFAKMKELKLKYSLPSNQKLSKFVEFLSLIKQKKAFKFQLPAKNELGIEINVKECDVAFDNLENTFEIKDPLIQTLNYLIISDEVNPEDSI